MILILWLIFILFVYSMFRLRHCVLTWWINRKHLIEMIDKIPGPPAIPILDFAEQILQYSLNFQEQGSQIVRIWLGPFPLVCLFSADSVQWAQNLDSLGAEYEQNELIGANLNLAQNIWPYTHEIRTVLENQTVIRKGSEYDIIIRWLGTGLLTSTGKKWRERRKMLTPAFHFNVLNGFLVTHDKESQIFIREIAKYADTNEIFNIYPFLKRLALDIICETSMGCKVNAQTNYEHSYVNSVQRMNELSFLYTRMPWLWIPPIWYLTGHGYEYARHLQLVTDFTRKVIADRRRIFLAEQTSTQSNEGNNDNDIGLSYNRKLRYVFLDLLLSIQSETGQLTDEDIREEVDTFMFEGHDTTSSGMAWSLWCLAHHYDFQQKILNEVDEIFGDSQRVCTNDDLKRLKYLEQCIKESLRLFPPVPLFTRMVEHDFECVGHTIPRGATILISPLVLHRDKRYFDNADQFNPDNFAPERCAQRHAFAYVPFSAGARNCIGQRFALMEEKTVLSWFFRHYTIRADMPMSSNLPCPEIILKPSKGIPVKIFRRNRIAQYSKDNTILKI